MIPPTGIQQPIPVVTQAQIPVASLLVDNQHLPQVPRPAQLFPSVAEKEAGTRNNQSQSSESSSLGATTGSEQAKIGEGENSGTGTGNEKNSEQRRQSAPEIQQQIRQLASRDREVRAHERAHSSVGGQFAGAPSFTFTRGPNGVLYAVSGEVSISTSGISGDPQASLAKLETVIRAALAPADPSSQDLRVAASAAAAVQRLKAEIASNNDPVKADESKEKSETSSNQNNQISTKDSLPTLQQRLDQLLEKSGAFSAEKPQPLLELSA